ncbi:MAG: DUF262 domain-containing protein [Kiritimatiellae bacterium]|nr:DUF262 domain-containing protein [Kiritimatiellia bacterium]
MTNEPNNGLKSYSFGAWTLTDILSDPRSGLSNALFRVPDYQRGYAWEQRQWTEFWNDVYATEKRYYTGAITVERNPKGFFDVVDGQQRLTTISLLLSVLDDPRNNPLFTPDSSSPVRFSYSDGNENRDFFERILALPVFLPVVRENDRIDYLPTDFISPDNSHQRNLLNAKAFFSRKVAEVLSNDRQLKLAFAKKLQTVLVFDFRILDTDDNAGLVFETMNNRGKPLTLLEKLKNRLMYLSELSTPVNEDDSAGVQKEELRAIIEKTWAAIYRELARHPDRQPLDEDEFVAAHLSLYRNPKESVYSESIAESRLFKMFCLTPDRYPLSEDVIETDTRSPRRSLGPDQMERPWSEMQTTIRKYVEDIGAFAPAWSTIHGEFDSACGHCRLLSATREIKIFLAAVWLHEHNESVRNNIFELAESILFWNTIGSAMDETQFATLARRMHGICLDQLKKRGGNQKAID